MITICLQTQPHLLPTYCCEENTSYSLSRVFFQVLWKVDEVQQRSVVRWKLLLVDVLQSHISVKQLFHYNEILHMLKSVTFILVNVTYMRY